MPAMRWDEIERQNSAYAAQIRQIYADAEEIMLEKVRKRLEKGIDEPGWAEKKLAEIRLLNNDINAELADLREADQGIDEAITKAYDSGAKVAAEDLIKANLLASTAATWTRGNSVRSLVKETTSAIGSTHFRILRTAQDAYRESVAAGSSQVLTGTQTVREAVQGVLDQFADRGISGYVDSAGKHWTGQSYAEMAVRTATQNASRQGHTDKLESSGFDLVIISSYSPTCELCYPWQGKVLSLRGQTKGYPTLAEAQDEGLYHPNCGHTQRLYTPGLTEETKEPTEEEKQANKEEYAALQKQRYLERGLRQWKRREAVAITPEAEAKAKAKRKEWSSALKDHVDTVNANYRAKYGKDVFGNDRQLTYRQSWREADKVTTQAEKDAAATKRRENAIFAQNKNGSISSITGNVKFDSNLTKVEAEDILKKRVKNGRAERAYGFNSKGKPIFAMDGDKETVNPSKEMLLNAQGGTVIHNHVDAVPHSPNDIAGSINPLLPHRLYNMAS